MGLYGYNTHGRKILKAKDVCQLNQDITWAKTRRRFIYKATYYQGK